MKKSCHTCEGAMKASWHAHEEADIYNTLQHTATNCNTLQHTAKHCNTVQHTATHCNTHATHMEELTPARTVPCCSRHWQTMDYAAERVLYVSTYIYAYTYVEMCTHSYEDVL